MERYSGAEIESPHAGGAGRYFFIGDTICPEYADSEEGLPDNPIEFKGCFKEDPTTRKSAYEMDPDEDTRYADTKQDEDLIAIAYIPILKYDFAIENLFFLPPEEIEYVSDILKLRDMEQEVTGMAEA
jgi:hypothetical protein